MAVPVNLCVHVLGVFKVRALLFGGSIVDATDFEKFNTLIVKTERRSQARLKTRPEGVWNPKSYLDPKSM